MLNKLYDKIKSQEGWSLPFTSIILVVIVALIYFFGWVMLLYVVGGFVGITLLVYLFDKIKSNELGLK